MLLSPEQQRRFWNKQTGWPAIVAARRWAKGEAEQQRKSMLARAGFQSLTLVDKVEGFTRVLHEMDALRDDLGGMVKHTDDANERRVLIFNIHDLGFHDAYIFAVSRDRFGTREWQTLPMPQLEQLRNTLANRARAKKKEREPVNVGIPDSIPGDDNTPF